MRIVNGQNHLHKGYDEIIPHPVNIIIQFLKHFFCGNLIASEADIIGQLLYQLLLMVNQIPFRIIQFGLSRAFFFFQS